MCDVPCIHYFPPLLSFMSRWKSSQEQLEALIVKIFIDDLVTFLGPRVLHVKQTCETAMEI